MCIRIASVVQFLANDLRQHIALPHCGTVHIIPGSTATVTFRACYWSLLCNYFSLAKVSFIMDDHSGMSCCHYVASVLLSDSDWPDYS